MSFRAAVTALVLAVVPHFGAAESIELRGAGIGRSFTYAQGFRTAAIFCPTDGWKLSVDSDELVVDLQDGRRVAGADWQLIGAPRARARGDEKALQVTLATDKAPGLRADIEYVLRAAQAWMRKRVTLSGPAGMVVTRVDLEPMTLRPKPPDLSGEGMPMLAGRAWFGVEFPASQNSLRDGRLSLVHFPGRDLGAGPLVCKTAVCGVAPPGLRLPLAFGDYLDTVATKSRSFLHYNSWYDLRGDELTTERLLEVFEGYRRNLLAPYGLKLAAFVPDDGWQDYQSIWRPRKNILPDGWAPLARALEARGSRLGLWMPLSGFSLDTNWGARQGYEVSNLGNWYCLGAPKFRQAMKEATAALIREANIAYYKHDFNMLACSADGHGHLPTPEAGHEANVDGTLELLHYERTLQPDIFLNVTSGMWYSPWWLMEADAIWGAFPGDTGYDVSWPQLTPREWTTSFYDAHLYRMYCQRPNNFVPVSRLMTHGVTQGRYAMLGGENEPLREWSDHVIWYFARGVQMKELYIGPDRMREEMWKPVGTAIRWAERRAETLAHVVMIGGDPSAGQPYGFIHWRGDEGIWALRNPDISPAEITVAVSQATGYRGKANRLYAAVTYPYVAPLPAPVTAGRDYRLQLPPASVVIVEVRPQPWGRPPAEPTVVARAEGDLSVSSEAIRATLSADVSVQGEVRQPRLYVVLRGGAMGPSKLDGLTVSQSRTVSGQGWQMQVFDLAHLPRQFRATLEFAKPGAEAFSVRPGTVKAWLVFEVAAQKTRLVSPPADLPWAIADGWRRTAVKLLDGKIEPSVEMLHVSDEELAAAAEAKLRVEIFGVNAGQYAEKYIYLNGTKLGQVPFNNQSFLDQWEERVIDLPPEHVKALRRDNVLVFTNETGDCYKVRALALAVRLPDGRWVQSEEDANVYCSVGEWLWTEGTVFEGGRSPEIHLRFP